MAKIRPHQSLVFLKADTCSDIYRRCRRKNQLFSILLLRGRFQIAYKIWQQLLLKNSSIRKVNSIRSIAGNWYEITPNVDHTLK